MSEIAARTGLVPEHRAPLLGTLVARGYAAQSPASGRYLMGYKLLELTSGLQDRLARLRTAARPHLEAIQEETGETTNLVVLEGRNVVYIDSVSGTRSVRLFTEIGRAIPAHTSGAGKALLAWREPADVEALLDGAPLPASTPHTLTTLDALQEDFAQHPPARLRDRQRGARTGRRAASRRRSSTARGSRSRRSACPARRRASCTRRRPTSRACCASTRSRSGRRLAALDRASSCQACPVSDSLPRAPAATRPLGRHDADDAARDGLRGSPPCPRRGRRSCRPCRSRRRCRA